ncbi:MAG TPA: TonB family protein [Allosphingosinicella sp.]|nr:TonB family protein [Allosphingosinicella sp.]
MSYVDQRMGAGRITSIVIVAILHALLGYALVTGMAYQVIKKAAEDLKTFDVNEEPPPPEEVPPPEKIPEVQPPPVVAPPPVVRMNTQPPPIVSVPIAPPPVITPTAPPAPPPPPPPKIEPARAKANLASYVSNDDYPDAALRNEEQGVTAFRLEVGPDGRVVNCTVTSSSGSTTLDNATCRIMKSRARFTPATDSSGKKVSDSTSSRIRWVLPPQ